MKSVVATSLAVIALVSIAGVLASGINGNLDVSIALPFSGGALLGMMAGRTMASRLPGPRLQQGFGMVACVVATGMLLKVFL